MVVDDCRSSTSVFTHIHCVFVIIPSNATRGHHSRSLTVLKCYKKNIRDISPKPCSMTHGTIGGHSRDPGLQVNIKIVTHKSVGWQYNYKTPVNMNWECSWITVREARLNSSLQKKPLTEQRSARLMVLLVNGPLDQRYGRSKIYWTNGRVDLRYIWPTVWYINRLVDQRSVSPTVC